MKWLSDKNSIYCCACLDVCSLTHHIQANDILVSINGISLISSINNSSSSIDTFLDVITEIIVSAKSPKKLRFLRLIGSKTGAVSPNTNFSTITIDPDSLEASLLFNESFKSRIPKFAVSQIQIGKAFNPSCSSLFDVTYPYQQSLGIDIFPYDLNHIINTVCNDNSVTDIMLLHSNGINLTEAVEFNIDPIDYDLLHGIDSTFLDNTPLLSAELSPTSVTGFGECSNFPLNPCIKEPEFPPTLDAILEFSKNAKIKEDLEQVMICVPEDGCIISIDDVMRSSDIQIEDIKITEDPECISKNLECINCDLEEGCITPRINLSKGIDKEDEVYSITEGSVKKLVSKFTELSTLSPEFTHDTRSFSTVSLRSSEIDYEKNSLFISDISHEKHSIYPCNKITNTEDLAVDPGLLITVDNLKKTKPKKSLISSLSSKVKRFSWSLRSRQNSPNINDPFKSINEPSHTHSSSPITSHTHTSNSVLSLFSLSSNPLLNSSSKSPSVQPNITSLSAPTAVAVTPIVSSTCDKKSFNSVVTPILPNKNTIPTNGFLDWNIVIHDEKQILNDTIKTLMHDNNYLKEFNKSSKVLNEYEKDQLNNELTEGNEKLEQMELELLNIRKIIRKNSFEMHENCLNDSVQILAEKREIEIELIKAKNDIKMLEIKNGNQDIEFKSEKEKLILNLKKTSEKNSDNQSSANYKNNLEVEVEDKKLARRGSLGICWYIHMYLCVYLYICI
jgi:hypothetical protein